MNDGGSSGEGSQLLGDVDVSDIREQLLHGDGFDNTEDACHIFDTTPPSMDLLVAQTYKNLTESQLLQLPDELILQIMKSLDVESIRCVRKSSRRFMYLFSFKDFQVNHRLHAVTCNHQMWRSVICPSQKDPMVITKETKLAKGRAELCDMCFKWFRGRLYSRQTTEELDYFHCSGCKSDHHARLFSLAELSRPPRERACIGREGFVRLCEHKIITYVDVCRAQAEDSGRRIVFDCHDPSHSFAGHRQGGEDVYVELYAGNSSGTALESASQHELRKLSFGKRTHFTPPTRSGKSRPTAQQFRSFLRRLQQNSPTPWYPLDNHSLSPLRMVDPNKCHCFHYEGSDLVRWPLRPNREEDAERECLWSGMAKYKSEPLCDNRAHSETQGFNYYHTNFSVSLWDCAQSSELECMTLTHWRHFQFDQPWSPQWIYALDPASYGQLGFGVAAPRCMTRGCRNYMKYETYGPLYACLGGEPEVTALANKRCRDNLSP